MTSSVDINDDYSADTLRQEIQYLICDAGEIEYNDDQDCSLFM